MSNLKQYIERKNPGMPVLTVAELYDSLDRIARIEGADPTYALTDFHGCKDSSKEEEMHASFKRYGPATWFSNNTLAGMSDVDPVGIGAAMHQAQSVIYVMGGPHEGLYVDQEGNIHEGLLERHNLREPGKACGALHGYIDALKMKPGQEIFDPGIYREMAIIEKLLLPHRNEILRLEGGEGRAASLGYTVNRVAGYASRIMLEQVLQVRSELGDRLALVTTQIMYDTGTKLPDMMVPFGPVYALRKEGGINEYSLS
jgi:hypothetical protein